MSDDTRIVDHVEIERPVRQGREVTTTAAGRAVSQTLGLITEALAQGKDPAYLRELISVQRDYISMQREIEADEARIAFNDALHAAQAEMPRVKKDGTIDLGADKSTGTKRGSIPFARWEDVDAVVRPIMRKHGFSVTFSEAGKDERGIKWRATHRHVRGFSDFNEMTAPPDTGPGRNALQALGSTASYMKRYLVEDFYNIVREGADDDGKRGGVRFLDDASIGRLDALLKETKTQESTFCEAMFGPDIHTLDEIEQKNFDIAVNALLKKKAKLASQGDAP